MTQQLPWHERKTSIPVVPGSSDDAISNLLGLLRLTDEANGRLDEVVHWPGTESTTLRRGLNRLGRCGLIRRIDRDTVELTASAKAWIETGDEFQLIRIFHENIRFIGELLHAISSTATGLTHEELRIVAVDTYRLPWDKVHPVRKWTTWLRAAGCAYLRFDGKLEITDAGRSILGQLEVATPEDVNGPDPSNIETAALLAKPSGLIKAAIDELDDNALRRRSFGYGYIPRPKGSTIPATMRKLVGMVYPEIERSQFVSKCCEEFGLGEPLGPRPLATLTTLGLVAQTGATTYTATRLAQEWIESGTDLDLVRIFHVRLAMVGELLDAIEHHEKAPELSRYASENYGFRHDVDGIRIRLHLLTAAGLLQEHALGRFRITNLGKAFRDSMPRLRPELVGDEQAAAINAREMGDVRVETRRRHFQYSLNTVVADDMAAELNHAALDSSNPERLEIAVRDAFTYLGFGAELLGGSGRTDVLVSYSVSPGETITVAVDAKSASSGIVPEGSINFDTIGEHKNQHNANLSCIVGPSFHQSRLPKWAKERGVALLSTNLLASAVRKQDQVALSVRDLAKVFNANLDPETSLMQAWSTAEQKNHLFASVVLALSREAQEADDVTQGSLSLDNLYFLLRSNLESKPDPVEIEQAVTLLASPLIGSAIESSGNYVITERPASIARKLRALALAVEETDDML